MFNDCCVSECVAVATSVLASSAAQRRKICKANECWGPNIGVLYRISWAQGPMVADKIPMQSSYYSDLYLNKVVNHPIPLILGLYCNFPLKVCCYFAPFRQNHGGYKSVLEKK